MAFRPKTATQEFLAHLGNSPSVKPRRHSPGRPRGYGPVTPEGRQTGVLIRGQRLRLGWSQSEMARRADVPRRAVEMIEKGHTLTRHAERLTRIRQALGI